jgi:predicted DNA-binding protein
MKVNELIEHWENTASGALTQESWSIRLPVEDAARLQALAEMFPRRSVEGLLTDLVSAALNDLESGFPYIRGNNVIAQDEEGDPMYEDVGPTPRYLALTRKHLQRLVTTRDKH